MTAADRLLWTAGFLVVSGLIVFTRFTSSDADSIRYATLSARLSELPVNRWVAPEWWGLTTTDLSGYFIEHPAGLFFIPAAMGRLGIPAEQAPYIFGVAAGLAALLLAGFLIGRLSTRHEGRAALVMLQVMPMAFVFRVRDNHEYPMLACLLMTVAGLAGHAGRWGSLALVAIGLTAGLLIKGVFVAVVLLGAGAWILVNPLGASRLRQIGLCAAGLAGMAVVAVLYDLWYLRETGGPFWSAYLQRQLGPMTVVSPLAQAQAFAKTLVFYVSRLLYHPAPWSLLLCWAIVRRRLPAPRTNAERGGLRFVLAFTGGSMLLLSLASRFAERYTFSGSFLFGAAGAVVAYRYWPALSAWWIGADTRVPGLPALVWTALVALRLVAGPWLPRI